MKQPNFKSINIKDFTAFKAVEKPESSWLTPEQIPVKPYYTKEDLEGMEHLNYAAGILLIRGPYSTMCHASLDHQAVCRFLDSRGINAFYRRNLAAGQKGLSVALTWQHTAAMMLTMKG